MMTDRELIEAAAKAAGMTGMKWTGSSLGKMIDPTRPDETGTVGPNWNPLADDADALRLAVKLEFTVNTAFMQHWGMNAMVTDDRCKANGLSGYGTTPHGDDPYAATRRAIVRAAAALAPTPCKESE